MKEAAEKQEELFLDERLAETEPFSDGKREESGFRRRKFSGLVQESLRVEPLRLRPDFRVVLNVADASHDVGVLREQVAADPDILLKKQSLIIIN